MAIKKMILHAGFAVVVIGMLGYFMLIQPIIAALSRERAELKRLEGQVAVLRVQARHDRWVIAHSVKRRREQRQAVNQDNDLSSVLATIESSGLQMKSIQAAPPSTRFSPIERMHFVLQGGFVQFAAFVFSLSKQRSKLIVRDFDYRQGLLDVEVIALPANVRMNASSHGLPVMPRDAICVGDKVVRDVAASLPALVQRSSVNHMKMVGYWHRDGRDAGLLMLPDGVMTAVRVGMPIGRERGIVLSISQHDISVLLPNGMQKRLSLKSSF